MGYSARRDWSTYPTALRLARLWELPDWPDWSFCPTGPTEAHPTEPDCINNPTDETGATRLQRDCYKVASYICDTKHGGNSIGT